MKMQKSIIIIVLKLNKMKIKEKGKIYINYLDLHLEHFSHQ
jgi:hypothetical protein